mgnify:CR=1 FL=1
MLIKAGADVNAVDEAGNTPLMYAIQCRDLRMIDLLINEGHADPNLGNTLGETPLSKAVDANREFALRLLRAPGINVNGLIAEGYTALYRAGTEQLENRM